MKLADVSIQRPVFATMLIMSLVVMGLFSYRMLGVDLFPNVDLPVVTVTTTLRGASPEEIETSVTKPLEEAINTISGIDELRSTSLEGVSIITVVFVLEKNGDVAAQDVRDKINLTLRDLPEGTDPPVVSKFEVDATPVMTLAVSGKRSLRELTEIAKKLIKEDIETLNGVGAISLIGGRERAVNVWLDPDKLNAYNLSIERIKAALRSQNLELPSGRVNQETQEIVLRTMGRMDKVEDFNNLIVANVNNTPLMIKDVGYVEDGIEEPRSISRLDGNNAVSLVIRKQSGTNTVQVIDRIKLRLEALKSILPPDIWIETIQDQSRFIKPAIHEVQLHLVLGGILASLSVLLFMQSFRSTLIASVAIPTSIIATFVLMRFLGFTLNNITMLGLVIAVGIVIDDAIVVLENIFRHIEEKGEKPRVAASTATREIGLAVMATTLSLVVIFLPIAFMQGRVGRFFSSYGSTAACAIMVSLFVSFTLTPMLSSRFLKVKHGDKSSKESFFYSFIERFYLWTLQKSMRHRWVIVLLAVLIVYSTGIAFQKVGKDFLPLDDQSEFEISVQAPEGSSLQKVDKYFRNIERDLASVRGVRNIFSRFGEIEGQQTQLTQGSIYVRLVDLEERTHFVSDSLKYFIFNTLLHRNIPEKPSYSQFDVMREVRQLLKKYQDLRTSVQVPLIISGSGTRTQLVNFNIRGPDLQKLQEYSERIMARMAEVPGIVDIDSTLSLRKPEIRINIDRKKASDLGVTVEDIASSVRTFMAGEEVTKYKEGADQYDVWVRLDEKYRTNPEILYQLSVPSQKVGLVKLGNLVTLEEAKGPAQIDRQSRQRQITILANLDNLALGDAMAKIQQFVKEMNLPINYQTDFSGRAKTLAETVDSFVIALVLSIIFMYMVLAAQFESFLHPITIMLSIPLSVPFALFSLTFLHDTLNIYSVLGLFMLFGVVKKNGILQVDYTNTLRAQGIDRDEAILEANKARLRPILMTTVTLIAGMIPIALGKGPGSASRATIANVIIGGQALSLLITLLITPVAYSLFDDIEHLRFVTWSKKKLKYAYSFLNGRTTPEVKS